MSAAGKPTVCRTCGGRGWLIHVFRERRPRPAYWFERGPGGERPRVCTDCGVIQNDTAREAG